jgi:integrase
MDSAVYSPQSTKLQFKKLPPPSFITRDGQFELKPKDTSMVAFIRRQVLGQSTPQNDDLLAWIRWYLKKEVLDVESHHTARSKIYDLWKFVVFYFRRSSSDSLSAWDKPCSQSLIDALESEYDISTVDRIYATISNFWNFLVVQEAVKAKDNPLKGITKRHREQLPPARGLDVLSDASSKIPDYGSEQKYEMFMNAAKSFIDDAKKYHAPLRDIAIVSFLYGSGLRAEELCGLTLKQMDRDIRTGGCWFHNVKCKGKRTRRAYLPSSGLEHLDRYLQSDERSDSSSFIFQSRNGQRLHQKDLWQILDRIAKRATALFLPPGYLFRVTPHTLRHERGYNLRKAGHGERFIAFALGHADTTQVPRYSMGNDLEEAVALEQA